MDESEGLAGFADFGRQMLIAASGPAPPDDSPLDRMLGAARRCVGGAAGAGLLFCGPGATLADAELMRAEAPAGDGGKRLLRLWRDDPQGPARQAWKRAEPVLCDAPGGHLQSDAASALWLPILEGRRQVLGVLQVADTTPSWPADAAVDRLRCLAAAALPALCRLLLRRRLAALGHPHDVVGISDAFLALEQRVRHAAAYADGPVLVLGERGSGKELVAAALHAWSPRRSRPYVPVLASAFSETLIADELFGHERHAFTGASTGRAGRFGAADGGTLFLDEVGDLPAAVQSSLMRVIDRGELPRIGRDLPLSVDVRVVAATNRDLGFLTQRGDFRPDLLDRLRVCEIRVPPLRERPEDIRHLASAFLQRRCPQIQRPRLLAGDGGCVGRCHGSVVSCTDGGFLDLLATHRWPGNVRELKNLIHATVANAPDEPLRPRHLPSPLTTGNGTPATTGGASEDLSLDTAVRRHLSRVLILADNNQSRAARLLGLPLSTLRNKMKRLDMHLPDGRRRHSRHR